MSRESEPSSGETSTLGEKMRSRRHFTARAIISGALLVSGISAFGLAAADHDANVRPVIEEVNKEAALLDPNELPCVMRADPKTELLARRGIDSRGLGPDAVVGLIGLGLVCFSPLPWIVGRGQGRG